MENILELQQVSKTFQNQNFHWKMCPSTCRMGQLWGLLEKMEQEKQRRLVAY